MTREELEKYVGKSVCFVCNVYRNKVNRIRFNELRHGILYRISEDDKGIFIEVRTFTDPKGKYGYTFFTIESIMAMWEIV